MINLFKHLLPRAKAWAITIDKQLRQFWEGNAESVTDTVEFLDDVYLDLFPSTTREITAWEEQFGVGRLDLTEAERRTRLAALWAAQGGQDPRYIQDTLQAAGFEVWVHEWWEPGSDPPIARNPNLAFGGELYGCDDEPLACGDTRAECGNGYGSLGQIGYALVNKLYTSNGVNLTRVEYTIPGDPTKWPYCMYVCGENFGEFASVPSARKDEFEDLCLKICPTQQWIIVGVTFVTLLIEGESGDFLTEGVGGAFLTEGS